MKSVSYLHSDTQLVALLHVLNFISRDTLAQLFIVTAPANSQRSALFLVYHINRWKPCEKLKKYEQEQKEVKWRNESHDLHQESQEKKQQTKRSIGQMPVSSLWCLVAQALVVLIYSHSLLQVWWHHKTLANIHTDPSWNHGLPSIH